LLVLIPVLAVAIVPNNQIFNVYLVWGNQELPTTWLVSFDAVVAVSFLAGVVISVTHIVYTGLTGNFAAN